MVGVEPGPSESGAGALNFGPCEAGGRGEDFPQLGWGWGSFSFGCSLGRKFWAPFPEQSSLSTLGPAFLVSVEFRRAPCLAASHHPCLRPPLCVRIHGGRGCRCPCALSQAASKGAGNRWCPSGGFWALLHSGSPVSPSVSLWLSGPSPQCNLSRSYPLLLGVRVRVASTSQNW